MTTHNLAATKLISDQTKGRVLEEFLRIVQGKLPVSASKSRLASHTLGAQFMSMLTRQAEDGRK